MRKIPVSGARMTAVNTPHMPTAVKLHSCSSKSPVRLTRRAKPKPVKAPMNIDGAKMPPSPPESTVRTETTTFSSSTAIKTMIRIIVSDGSIDRSGELLAISERFPAKSFSM